MRETKKDKNKKENELVEALKQIEEEKGISKEVLIDAIENSLIQACKSHFGRADNIKVVMNRETCNYQLYAEKEVVEEVEDPLVQITLEAARKINPQYYIGDYAQVPIESKNFGRISAQVARNVILQKIREEERNVLNDYYNKRLKEVVTGIVQKVGPNGVSLNIGKCDATMPEEEMVPEEEINPTEKIKVYIYDVKSNTKGPRIQVSRKHPELVKRLFESQVSEIKEGIVEIKGVAREAGKRTKMAVYSNNENVDAIGSCVGANGERVNAIVEELRGEKVDIIYWNENPAIFIENALNPAKVICVIAAQDEKTAQVIVPDNQLSLAIGKDGQNARLAAKLTGYKIDIKSETEARDAGLFEGIDELNQEEEFIGYSEIEDDGEEVLSFEDIGNIIGDIEE